MREYDFEKNLPSIKENVSKWLLKQLLELIMIKRRLTGKRYFCKCMSFQTSEEEKAIIKNLDI
jgi:hypothetical protein